MRTEPLMADQPTMVSASDTGLLSKALAKLRRMRNFFRHSQNCNCIFAIWDLKTNCLFLLSRRLRVGSVTFLEFLTEYLRVVSVVSDCSAFVCSQKKPIRDLRASKEIALTDTIGGKVVCKSTLQTSKTKNFFDLYLTDETACLHLTVYGKPNHQKIKQGKFYSFRNLTRDEAGHVKVTSETSVAQIASFTIPKKVEKEAVKLCTKSPFRSVKDFTGTGSVAGSVTEVSSDFALFSDTFFMFHSSQHRTNTEERARIFLPDI